MEDSDIKRILDAFFQKDQSGKYQYSYYTGKKGYTASRAVIKMLGIYTDDIDRTTGRTEFYYERFENVVYTILTILNGIDVLDEPPPGTQVNNFLLLMPHDSADMVLVNDPSNINMFGEVGYVVYDGNTYAVPRLLLDTNATDSLLYARFMGMLMFLMRYAQTEGAKGSAKMKINRRQKYDSKAFTNTVGKAMKGKEGPPIKPVDRYVPPIQPETGQTEDVRPDVNLQLYYTATNPEFIKTHNTIGQTVVTLEPEDVITMGFEPELDEVDRELLEEVNENGENIAFTSEQIIDRVNNLNDEIRQLDEQIRQQEIEQIRQAVIVPEYIVPESRNVVNLEQLIDQAMRQIENPSFVRQITQEVRSSIIVERPLQNIQENRRINVLDAISGFGGIDLFIDVGPTGFFNNDDDDEDVLNDNTVFEVIKNNKAFYRSLTKEIYLDFVRFVTSTFRGSVNICNQVIQDNLLDINEDTLRDGIAGLVNQLDIFVNTYPNLINISAVLGYLTTLSIILISQKYIVASLLNTLGLTTGPSVFVDVDNITIIKDMNGNTLNTVNNGEVNFSPDPISSQTGYEVVKDPEHYIITKILPSQREVRLKATFDVGLYNFIGNRMLSISKLNMEPTFTQPGYSLLTNISTEIDTLYTALVQGDKTAIDRFLPEFNNFLVKNKDVILNHVNQPYYPGDPDPDPEDDDDDISSGSSGSPFPKKPKKFADSKQGEWYIMKTLIYWLMRHASKAYEYTSVHMQNLFLVSQDIASSIYTTIIGRHPYLFTTGIALTLLRPQFIPEIYETFVIVSQGILTITKSVFSFFSSTSGLVLLGVGAFFLLYTFAKSSKKISLL